MPPWIRSCCLLNSDKITITGACKFFKGVLSAVVHKTNWGALAPLAPLVALMAIRAHLGVAGHLSAPLRWGNPDNCFSQGHIKLTCRLVLHTVPLILSVKQGSGEYQFLSHWFAPTRNQIRVYSSRSGRSYHSAI